MITYNASYYDSTYVFDKGPQLTLADSHGVSENDARLSS